MKRGAVTLWIAAAFAFFLLPAAARNTRKPHLAYHSASKRGGKRPAAQKQTGTVWAVVVGVNKYPEGVPSLQYPEADARLLYETLLAKGIGAKRENIFLLTAEPGQPATLAPTRANILRSLREIAAKAKPQDTIWFYFGGHGLDRGGQSYLVPADIQPADLIGSALAVSDIRNLLAKACPQGQRVLALDACHSGSPRDFALVEAAAKNAFAIDRMVTFAACDVGEQTWEFPDPPGGVFTHFMTRGLRGGADQNHDGLVSSQELYAYVSQRVKQTVFQLKNVNQTPQMLCKVGADLTLAAAGAAPSEDNLPPHLNPTHRFAPLLLISLTDVANGDGLTAAEKLETVFKQDWRDDLLFLNRADTAKYLAAGADREAQQKAAALAGKRGANFFLVGSVSHQLTAGTAGGDSLDMDMGFTGELYDAQGKVIQAVSLTVTVAEFSEKRAIETGVKKLEAALSDRLEADLNALIAAEKTLRTSREKGK